MNVATNAYQQTNVMTANPVRLVVMLYEGAAGYLKQAIHAAETGDMKSQNTYANMARDIVLELNNCLDVEKGGQIASNLRSVYLFINRHLLKAGWNGDVRAFQDSIRLLDSLREAWEDITDQGPALAYQQAQPAGMAAVSMSA